MSSPSLRAVLQRGRSTFLRQAASFRYGGVEVLGPEAAVTGLTARTQTHKHTQTFLAGVPTVPSQRGERTCPY